jgi:hypothetical protein
MINDIHPYSFYSYRFCDGLVKSRIFLPLISKAAINSDSFENNNFGLLKSDSLSDNLLLEYWLALELMHRGFIEKIYPLLIGRRVTSLNGEDYYTNFFEDGIQSLMTHPVVVGEVESRLEQHLDRLCLGTPFLLSQSVGNILSGILKNQGRLIEGDCNNAFELVPDDVTKMKQRILLTQSESHERHISSDRERINRILNDLGSRSVRQTPKQSPRAVEIESVMANAPASESPRSEEVEVESPSTEIPLENMIIDEDGGQILMKSGKTWHQRLRQLVSDSDKKDDNDELPNDSMSPGSSSSRKSPDSKKSNHSPTASVIRKFFSPREKVRS